MSRSYIYFLVPVLLMGLIAVGYGVQAGVFAQVPEQDAQQRDDREPQQKQARGKPKMQMMCPMMAGLKNVELHADSPELVLARDKDLELTEEQRTELEKILETARNKARETLTAQQREQLEQAPEGPLSMMQIAKLLKKSESSEGDSGQMCPMCMKMMQEKTPRRQQKPNQ